MQHASITVKSYSSRTETELVPYCSLMLTLCFRMGRIQRSSHPANEMQRAAASPPPQPPQQQSPSSQALVPHLTALPLDGLLYLG
ncbi:hypothetical protein AALO_G00004460 [Alosa alosa]|uniref:Uncharacterized protein n=1 Tax=Alosa alosa TaxID=278164 RepID=A0AAV6HGC6_9TELE|nr:hypothetical protein AALO_G00004460 [Alosa alosa]